MAPLLELLGCVSNDTNSVATGVFAAELQGGKAQGPAGMLPDGEAELHAG